MATCSVWLAWRCGLTQRAAQEQVRVARALERLPEIRATFARGELTYSKVRAITRVACAENEQLMLAHAQHATAAQLERICRRYRGASLADAKRARELRHFAYSWDPEDGSLIFNGRLAPEEGALLLAALESGFDTVRAQRAHEVEDEGRDDRSPTNADGLVAVVEAALTSGERRSSGGDRHQLVLHVELETLAGGEGSAHIEGGPSIAVETARRLGCDASIVTLIEKEGIPLSVGRKTRTIPPALRRAIYARDETCRYPGCENRRFTDLHHIKHWADGGETSYENLIRLCTYHHGFGHEGGFTIEALAGDRFAFRRPDGSVIPECPSLRVRGPDRVTLENRRRGLDIDPGTCRSLDNGERFDMDITVEGLCRAAPAGGPRGP